MDFKETYKKYLDGTATDEEKAFVESEMEKVRLVNDEIIAASVADVQSENEIRHQKRKKKIKQTLKIIIVSALVFIVIALIAFGTVFGISVSSAIDNLSIEPDQAREEAIEYAFTHARDHYGYTGSVEAITLKNNDMISREFVFVFPLKKCHYVYEFEFLVGNMEMDIDVNTQTGMCTITDIDRMY